MKFLNIYLQPNAEGQMVRSDFVNKELSELWVHIQQSDRDGKFYAVPDEKVHKRWDKFDTEDEAVGWASKLLRKAVEKEEARDKEEGTDPSLKVINATKDDAWSIPPNRDHIWEKGRLLIAYRDCFLSLFYGHFWAWKEEDPDSVDPTYGPVELLTDTPGEVEYPDDHPFEDWFVEEVLRVVWGVC